MVSMANTDFIPALAADLKGYEGTPLAGGRPAAYGAVATAAEALSKARDAAALSRGRALSLRARARAAALGEEAEASRSPSRSPSRAPSRSPSLA